MDQNTTPLYFNVCKIKNKKERKFIRTHVLNVSYKMFYVSTLLLYNTLQAATSLVDTIVYEAL